MYRIRFTIFFLLLNAVFIKAQIQYQGRPVELKYPGMKIIPVLELYNGYIDNSTSAPVPESSRLKPDEFAGTVNVNYDYMNSGVWDTLDNGIKLWRLGIHAKEAVSINIIFVEYNLAKGTKVFIYDRMQKNVLGALTYKNNKAAGILATSSVTGDFIYLEMQVPEFLTSPGKLKIGLIGLEYKKYTGRSRLKDKWYGTSGYCNVDINCIENATIQKMKYSVCRIVYGGQERCTGTLINNVYNNGRPYILTAQHCLSTDYLAQTAIFYFDYESPYCDGPDGNALKSVSGSSLIATTDNKLDFSLVQLSASPPFSYKPFYAGWDNLDTPPVNTYSIHHPQGDVKKISFDSNEATTSDFGEGYDYYTHWLISDWESGTTEKGSSGCPLFNRNGRLVGSLSGGDADCELSVNDYYQKFSLSWDGYPERNKQLKYWLDPENTGAKYIDGFDPYESFWQSGDTISNIRDADGLSLLKGSLDWGYLSGHNSDSIRMFAEKFNISGRKKMFGTFINIAALYYASNQANINLSVWSGNDQPGQLIMQKKVLMIDMLADTLNFIEFDSILNVNNTFYLGYQLEYNNPLDTFAVFMSEKDDGNSINTAMITYNNNWAPVSVLTTGNVPAAFDIRPLIFDSIDMSVEYDTTLATGEIKITHLPAGNIVKVEFYEWPDQKAIINIISLSGQLLATKSYEHPDKIINFDVAGLGNGIYIMQVLYKYFAVSEKLPVLR